MLLGDTGVEKTGPEIKKYRGREEQKREKKTERQQKEEGLEIDKEKQRKRKSLFFHFLKMDNRFFFLTLYSDDSFSSPTPQKRGAARFKVFDI